MQTDRRGHEHAIKKDAGEDLALLGGLGAGTKVRCGKGYTKTLIDSFLVRSNPRRGYCST